MKRMTLTEEECARIMEQREKQRFFDSGWLAAVKNIETWIEENFIKTDPSSTLEAIGYRMLEKKLNEMKEEKR